MSNKKGVNVTKLVEEKNVQAGNFNIINFLQPLIIRDAYKNKKKDYKY